MALYKRDYGISCTIEFPLYDTTGVSLAVGATFAAGDCKIIKDGAASANTTNLPTDEGNGEYSLVLTATEMQAAHISISLDDQTATELWAGTGFQVETRITVGEYGGGVWYDEAASGTGTTVGVHGTPLRPVNVFADAVTLAASTGLRRVYVAGVSGPSFAISAAASGIEVIGLKSPPTAVFTSAPVVTARFANCSITGALGSGSTIYTDGGFASDLGVGVATLVLTGTGLSGTIGLRASVNSQFIRCYGLTVAPPSIDCSPTAASADFIGYGGAITLINMGATNEVRIDGTGTVTIAASCTGGTLRLRGQFQVVDNSSGAVTIDNTATGVNVTSIAGDTTLADSFASLIETEELVAVTATGNAITFTCGGLLASTDNNYVDRAIVFHPATPTAALRGVMTWIRGSTGSPKTLTVDPLPASPAIGDILRVRA